MCRLQNKRHTNLTELNEDNTMNIEQLLREHNQLVKPGCKATDKEFRRWVRENKVVDEPFNPDCRCWYIEIPANLTRTSRRYTFKWAMSRKEVQEHRQAIKGLK